MANQCKWILKTGPYAGKVCGNNCFREFCSQHNKLYVNSLRRTDAIRSLINSEANPIFGGVNARIDTNIADADNIADDIGPPAQAGGGYEKHKWSVYLITINSQKDALSMSEDDRANFKSFIDKNVLGDGVFKYFEDKKSPKNPRKNMINVLQDGKYEIGEMQGRLHFHGIIRIEHTGLLQFHATKLRNDAKKELGYPIYLASPVSSDPIAAYQQYFEKKINTQ